MTRENRGKNWKTTWKTYINGEDLQKIFSSEEIIQLSSEADIFYYNDVPDNIVVVKIDEDKKTIDVHKDNRYSTYYSENQRTLIQQMLGHLDHGTHYLSVSDEELRVLSSPNTGLMTYSEHFIWGNPPYELYTSKEYNADHVLIKLVHYLSRDQSIEEFITVSLERVVIFHAVNLLKQDIVFKEEDVLYSGIRFLGEMLASITGTERMSDHTLGKLFDYASTGEIRGYFGEDYNSSIKRTTNKYNISKLLQLVVYDEENKEEKEKEDIEKSSKKEAEENSSGLLDKVKSHLSKSNTKHKLSKIVETGKIPKGHGALEIDVPNSFYPHFMKKVKAIYYNDAGIVINMKKEARGVTRKNASDILGLEEKNITVFTDKEKKFLPK